MKSNNFFTCQQPQADHCTRVWIATEFDIYLPLLLTIWSLNSRWRRRNENQFTDHEWWMKLVKLKVYYLLLWWLAGPKGELVQCRVVCKMKEEVKSEMIATLVLSVWVRLVLLWFCNSAQLCHWNSHKPSSTYRLLVLSCMQVIQE